MSGFLGLSARSRVLAWRLAIAAGVAAVTCVVIATQAGGLGPVRADAAAAHILRAGAVSGLNAGSPGGLNGAADEPSAGTGPWATATKPHAHAAAISASPRATPGQRDLPSASAGGFAPYVDVTDYPPYNLVSTAQQTGVKQFNLAFIVAGGGCTPEWGGTTPIGDNPVAAQIGALRAIGSDVRISFGGEAGDELALACASAPSSTPRTSR